MDKERLKSFELKNDIIEVVNSEKNEIIRGLSAGLMTFSEKEIIMNITTFLQNTSQPVLFTEGITDQTILEKAWNKLYNSEAMPFCIQSAFGRNFLRNLFSRDDLKRNYGNRLMFVLFDFDDAYDDWNGLKYKDEGSDKDKKWKDEVLDPFKGLARKNPYANHFAFLLPVPNNVKNQVLDENNQPWGNGAESHLSIELLFYKEDLIDRWYKKRKASGGAELIEFINENKKIEFSEKFIPTLNKDSFEIFRPMFEFIRNKCQEKLKADER